MNIMKSTDRKNNQTAILLGRKSLFEALVELLEGVCRASRISINWIDSSNHNSINNEHGCH